MSPKFFKKSHGKDFFKVLWDLLEVHQVADIITTIAGKINETMSRNQAKLNRKRNFDISFCVIFDH